MSKIDIKLSDMGKESAIFHDLRFANDRAGGNSNIMKLEIRNISGNTIDVQIGFHEKDDRTGKWQYKWKPLQFMIKKQKSSQLTALQCFLRNIGLLMVPFMLTMPLSLLKHM